MGPPSFRHARARLAGRGAECARLDQVLADARLGQSSVLVLRGEAGIGKSALLEYAAERAEGCRVLRAIGVEWEMELAIAGLYQLYVGLQEGRELAARRQCAHRSSCGVAAEVSPSDLMTGDHKREQQRRTHV